MLVVVMTAAAALLFVVMMLMVMMLQLRQFLLQSGFTGHSLQQLSAGQFVPGGNYQGCGLIMLPQQRHGGIQLGLGDIGGTGEDDGGCGLDLVVIEFAKILHIELDLACISHSHLEIHHHIVAGDLLHGSNHIAELAHTGGFDDDAVGIVLLDDLHQGLTEIAHQAAADATGVHLGDVDARILQEATVDADLAEFVFDEHQVLALVGFLDHFLDEGGLTGAEEAGVNINLGHKNEPPIFRVYPIL